MTAAQIIAQNLAALPHPDGTPRQLPGFATQLLPEPMAQQVTQTARELGEAIIHLLDINGYKVGTAAEFSQPAADQPPQIANVHCVYCEARVMQLNITNPARVPTAQHYIAPEVPERMTDFHPDMLPPRPQLIPDGLAHLVADNTGADWQTKVPPQAVGMFIAAVVRWLSEPRMGTKVTVDTKPTGWTIQVDLPTPDIRDDIVLPDA